MIQIQGSLLYNMNCKYNRGRVFAINVILMSQFGYKRRCLQKYRTILLRFELLKRYLPTSANVGAACHRRHRPKSASRPRSWQLSFVHWRAVDTNNRMSKQLVTPRPWRHVDHQYETGIPYIWSRVHNIRIETYTHNAELQNIAILDREANEGCFGHSLERWELFSQATNCCFLYLEARPERFVFSISFRIFCTAVPVPCVNSFYNIVGKTSIGSRLNEKNSTTTFCEDSSSR